MKLIILDYLLRKGWRLILAALLEILFGYLIAVEKIWYFQFVIVSLLSTSDIQEGIARTLASLPLTAKEISRAWWLATVGIPAVVLAAMLFGVVGFVHLLNPTTPFPVGDLINLSFMALLFLVAQFGIGGASWGFIISPVEIGAIYYLFFLLPAHLPRTVILIAAGIVMVAVQWFYAELWVPVQARTRKTARPSKSRSGTYRPPTRYGGILLLIEATVIRTFVFGLPLLPILLLVHAYDEHVRWRDAASLINGMSLFPYCLIPVYPLIFVLMQLRYLRTLPISSTKLAALILLVALLPVIGLIALPVCLAGWVSGPPAAFAILQRFAFLSAPAALCIAFAVWRGISVESYLFAILAMLVFQLVPLFLGVHYQNAPIPFIVPAVILAICVTVALMVTRRLLVSCTYTYRIQRTRLDQTALL